MAWLNKENSLHLWGLTTFARKTEQRDNARWVWTAGNWEGSLSRESSKYWAICPSADARSLVCSPVRSHGSLVHWLRTICLARALHYARPLTHGLVWDRDLMSHIRAVLNHSAKFPSSRFSPFAYRGKGPSRLGRWNSLLFTFTPLFFPGLAKDGDKAIRNLFYSFSRTRRFFQRVTVIKHGFNLINKWLRCNPIYIIYKCQGKPTG